MSDRAPEPIAWMWQHDETGRTGFVDVWQVKNGWQAANPRLLLVSPLCRAPSAPATAPACDRFCPACFVEVTPEQADAVTRDARRYRWLRGTGPEQLNAAMHYADGALDAFVDGAMALSALLPVEGGEGEKDADLTGAAALAVPGAAPLRHVGQCATDEAARQVCDAMYRERTTDNLALCEALRAVYAVAGEDKEIARIVHDAIRQHGVDDD